MLAPLTQRAASPHSQADAHRMLRPGFADEIAPVVAWLCSDAPRWISGANIPVDGGLASTYI